MVIENGNGGVCIVFYLFGMDFFKFLEVMFGFIEFDKELVGFFYVRFVIIWIKCDLVVFLVLGIEDFI